MMNSIYETKHPYYLETLLRGDVTYEPYGQNLAN